MKRVLITGGGGFIGKSLALALHAGGLEVAVLGRRHYAELAAAGIELFQGDIRNADLLNQVFSDFDAVFHVAAKAGIWGNYNDYYTTNVLGTRNVISACRLNQVGVLVHTSTPSVVFAGESIEGGDESLPYATRFLCHYAATKAMAEREVLAADCAELKTVALRPHLVFGPGDTNLLPRLVERGRRRHLKMVGDGANLVDISYIDNVVQAHILAAENLFDSGTAAGRAYFISQGEPVRLWGWINDFFKKVGVPPVTGSLSLSAAWRMGAVLEGVYGFLRIRREPLMTRFLAEQLARSHWFSLEAAQRDLGYKPTVDLETGLERSARWLLNDRV